MMRRRKQRRQQRREGGEKKERINEREDEYQLNNGRILDAVVSHHFAGVMNEASKSKGIM